MQVFFSKRCPLLNWDLPFFQRLWYSYAAWAPITTILTVPGVYCQFQLQLLSIEAQLH
jgi:hypothetical protein